jgi:predicted MFS family arabinose efflux permease
MKDTVPLAQRTVQNAGTPAGLVLLLLAFACGLTAANVYYAQPVASLIGTSLGLSSAAAGLIVTMTQIGTGFGTLFVVPLGDLIESKRLALGLLCIATIGLIGAALSRSASVFLLTSFLIGLGSVAIHVLVPYAAHLAPERIRGRVVGNITSSVLVGIMLSRPTSSLVTYISSSWHTIFICSATLMGLLVVMLACTLAPRFPKSTLSYGELLASMGKIFLSQRVVRRRSIYHGCLGAAFSVFWTTTPLLLAGPAFRLSQAGIGLFALVGISGAVAATLCGSLADRGWTRGATAFAKLAVLGGFLMTRIVELGTPLSLALLITGGALVDFGVCGNMSVGQRAIFGLGAQFRSRVNGIYVTSFFAGSALGSALGGLSYSRGGWHAASVVGLIFPALALVYFISDRERLTKGEASS